MTTRWLTLQPGNSGGITTPGANVSGGALSTRAGLRDDRPVRRPLNWLVLGTRPNAQTPDTSIDFVTIGGVDVTIGGEQVSAG